MKPVILLTSNFEHKCVYWILYESYFQIYYLNSFYVLGIILIAEYILTC